MTRLTNWLGGLGREDKEILARLNLLDRRHLPVRMEIENSSIHFSTRISVKSSAVVVAKPLNLRDSLRKGGVVRLQLPEDVGREVRMEVLTPHFNLTNGNPVFLCRIPTEYAQANQRAAVRFNTSRFSNVVLAFDGHAERCRIVDISMGGCKVFVTSKEAKERLTVGVPLQGYRIELGDKVTVPLKQLVPRSLRGQAVGCQFEVSDEGRGRSFLTHLLKTLERTELERYQA